MSSLIELLAQTYQLTNTNGNQFNKNKILLMEILQVKLLILFLYRLFDNRLLPNCV